MIGMESMIISMRWAGRAIAPLLRLPLRGTRTRINDGKVDSAGRLWVGSMHVPVRDGRFEGSLFCIERHEKAVELLTSIGVANGIAVTPGAERLYFADSVLGRVWTSPSSTIRHDLVRTEPFIDFERLRLPGRPDGACLDSDGRYWLACVYGSAIVCVSPSGTVEEVIDLPVSRPTSVAFGGPRMDTLFVTTIGGGRGDYAVASGEVDSGRVLALSVDARGVPEPRLALEQA